MESSFAATADVKIKDGLVCVIITAPGAPETVLRLPSDLAREIARRILSAADKAPPSWPSDAARRAAQTEGEVDGCC